MPGNIASAGQLLSRLLFFSLLLAVAYGCVEPKILRVADRRELKPTELLKEIDGRDIVFVGEVHTKKSHHKAQLEIIKALDGNGKKVAIGVEMFKKEDQEALDKWVSGEIEEAEFSEIYHRNWGLPWTQYRDIFVYAREKQIPLVGLNVSRSVIRQVVREGFSSLTPEQLSGLPSGIECKVDATYEEFIKDALGEHAGEMSFKNFCEAQMVWDNAMAHNAIEYLDANPARRLVVLAGSGHSWKRGIPAQVTRLSGYSFSVILPESDRVEVDKIDTKDADYIITGWFF
ncbi:MAG: hypothetical protein A2052_09685 [Deltaproteobacteria bacterium GWA2_54_12]|nr:MAG: hypothetical protein A2052_09685 [Deltaproteobacteria bacterium GWA2_54_12]